MVNFIGRTIQHYQILSKIRETPTRILYKAYNKKAHAYTAFEVVKKFQFNPAELLTLINEESYQSSKLSHPNIKGIADSGIYNGLVYIVYDFFPTHTLHRLFNRVYSWEEMSRELVAIAHALAHAHENGMVHGYLGPSSIVLDEKQNPILFDFGLEHLITSYILAHSPGTWINGWNIDYRAPEQMAGGAPNAGWDIYSFGMIINEWLTGKSAVTDAERSKDNASKRSLMPIRKKAGQTLSPVIQKFLLKCRVANPSKRYRSMQEVLIILANGALNMQVTTQMVRRPLSHSGQFFSWGWSIAVLALGILLLVSGGFFLNQSKILLPPASTRLSPTVFFTPAAKDTQRSATATLIVSTSTPTAPVILDTSDSQTEPSFPLFQDMPIPSTIGQTLSPVNANQMVMVALWGLGNAHDLAISPDGQDVAVASTVGIFVFDARNLSFKYYIDTRSSVNIIKFSPDGKVLASGDNGGLIQLWNTATWENITNLPKGHTQAISDLMFSPNGQKLASIGKDNVLIQWKISTLENQKADLPARSGANTLVYSTDGTQIIIGGDDFIVHIWDASNLSPLRSKNFSSKVVQLVSVKNTSLLAVGASDQKVALLDLAHEMNVTPLGSIQYPLTSITASPDGNLIAAGDINGGITMWDRSGRVFWKTQNYITGSTALLDLPGSPHSIAFNSDGQLLFSALHNGIIRSLDSSSGKDVSSNRSFDAHAEKLAISANNQYALTQDENETITLWDIANGTPFLRTVKGEIKEGNPFSQDAHFIAIALSKNTMQVYELPGMNEFYTFYGHRDVRTIQFINNDAQLAGGFNEDMHLWSTSSGQELQVKTLYPGRGCRTITDLNEAPIFSVTGYQHIVLRNSSNSGMCMFEKGTWTAYFDDANGLIAYGGSGNLSVLNSRTNGQPVSMNGIEWSDTVKAVAISPRGDLLAAAIDDQIIHVWDISTSKELTSLFGHEELITNVLFTPDGKWLFSTSRDGTIRIWGIPN